MSTIWYNVYIQGGDILICEKHMIYNTRLSDERIYIQEIGSEACSCEKKSRTHIFQYNSLHFILDGEGMFNGQPVKKGDCFYVREKNLAIYEVNPENPWQYFWINFSGSLCEDAMDQIGLTSGSGIFHLSDIEKIRAIFKDAFSKRHQNADVHFYMDSYFFRLVGAIASEFEKTNAKPSPLSLSESRFRQALVFIGNNYTHRITVADVANSLQVERQTLSRIFQKFSDRSPQTYILEFRMEKAKSLLLTTTYSITAIAYSVGYDDVLQFSKIFKAKVGLSTKKYREEVQTHGTTALITEDIPYSTNL